MKMRVPFLTILGMTAFFATNGWTADAPKPPTPSSSPGPSIAVKGFDAFRLVKSRNIFDPDRRGMPSSAPSSRPSAPRKNTINLTGTMVAEGKTLAFFAGSRSEYNKVISIGESIADFKVTGITNAQVELSHAGKTVTVAVGKQVPLEGTAAGIVADASLDSNSPASSTDDTTPAEPAADSSTPAETKPADKPADEQNDVLRRMMERRQKELSK